MTADCTDLEIQDVTEPRSKEVHSNLLLQIRRHRGQHHRDDRQDV